MNAGLAAMQDFQENLYVLPRCRCALRGACLGESDRRDLRQHTLSREPPGGGGKPIGGGDRLGNELTKKFVGRKKEGRWRKLSLELRRLGVFRVRARRCHSSRFHLRRIGVW